MVAVVVEVWGGGIGWGHWVNVWDSGAGLKYWVGVWVGGMWWEYGIELRGVQISGMQEGQVHSGGRVSCIVGYVLMGGNRGVICSLRGAEEMIAGNSLTARGDRDVTCSSRSRVTSRYP